MRWRGHATTRVTTTTCHLALDGDVDGAFAMLDRPSRAGYCFYWQAMYPENPALAGLRDDRCGQAC